MEENEELGAETERLGEHISRMETDNQTLLKQMEADKNTLVETLHIEAGQARAETEQVQFEKRILAFAYERASEMRQNHSLSIQREREALAVLVRDRFNNDRRDSLLLENRSLGVNNRLLNERIDRLQQIEAMQALQKEDPREAPPSLLADDPPRAAAACEGCENLKVDNRGLNFELSSQLQEKDTLHQEKDTLQGKYEKAKWEIGRLRWECSKARSQETIVTRKMDD